jgi:hypothetical protein
MSAFGTRAKASTQQLKSNSRGTSFQVLHNTGHIDGAN